MRNGTTLLGSTVQNGNVIGAGGWMTGLQTADDGTLFGRCDTRPPLSLAPGATAWIPNFQAGVDVALTDLDLDFSVIGPGTYAAGISPSNSAVRMVAWRGWVWVKKPSATIYTKTTLARRFTIDGNSGVRMTGNPLVCDPANPAHWIFVAPEGVFRTTDYGDTWATVSGVPAPTSGTIGSVAFDRSQAAVGGITQRFYVFTTQVYRSTNGGTSFAALSGSPTTAADMAVSSATGTLLVSGNSTQHDGVVNRWNGTAWSASTLNGGSVKNVAFSTFYANRVYALDEAGNYRVSTDDGVTFAAAISAKPIVSLDVPWQTSDTGYKSVGGMVERPTDHLPYISTGVGCWKLPSPPLSGTSVDWAGISLGIENMVGTCANYAPDGSLSITMQDKQSMLFAPGQAGRSLPADYGPYRGSILRGPNCDYAPEDTMFWVTTVVGRDIGYTMDRGKTWTTCPSLRVTQGWTSSEITDGQGGGGQVAVLSKDVWITGSLSAFPMNSATRSKNALYITRDRGATWTEVVIGNGNAVSAMLPNYSGSARKVLTKDPYYSAAGVLGRVYFYNAGDTDNTTTTDNVACKGVWQIDVPTANTAPAVTRKSSSRLVTGNQDIIHNKLVVMGAAGKLAFVGGDGMPFAFRSNDGGATWTEFGGTDDQSAGTKFAEVYGIGVGRARFDSAFPTIYAVGYRDTGNTHATHTAAQLPRYGLWASYDDGTTWKRLTQFPGGASTIATDLAASMVTFGEVVVTLGGQGAATLLYDYKLRLT